MLTKTLFLLAALTVGTLSAIAAAQDPVFLGVARIPGTVLDRSGLAGNMQSASGVASDIPQALFGGAGSAIDYTGRDNLYLMASDRGPSDGQIRYANRVHTVRITLHPGAPEPLQAELVSTTLLEDSAGHPYNGSSASGDLRLDPEALRCLPDGSFWLSDEYGPFVFHFNPQGRLLESFPVPTKFTITSPSADAEAELRSNKTGRQPNRGMEGLAISPDHTMLTGLMQSPLIQDHGVDARFARTGQLCRILTMNLKDRSTHEYVYPLDSAKLGLNELLAINDHEFLAIERDGKAGKESAAKHIVHIDLTHATDISNPFVVDGKTYDYSGTTAANGLPAALPVSGVTPAAKSLFLDLLSPAYGLNSDQFPEKIEGIAWGPDFDNGDKLLVISTDNDFIQTQPTTFFAFRIPTPHPHAAAQ